MKYAVKHSQGCGGIAFFYDFIEKPDGREYISSSRAEMPDGSRPIAGDQCVCGNCGKRIDPKIIDCEKVDEAA